MSELMLVSVPGIVIDDHDGALLRVLMVPRLSGHGTTLADYQLVDWPAALAQRPAPMQIRLRTAAGHDLPAIDAEVHHVAESSVWRGFFSSIAVTPYTGARTYPGTSVTPTAKHAKDVHDAYAATVTAVGEPSTVEEQLEGLDFEVAPPEPDPAAPVMTPRDPDFRDPDFHRVVTLMRQHPVVMRALGLIVEVCVPRAKLTECGGSGEVAVSWANPPVPFDTITSPRTAFVVKQKRFHAAPATTTDDAGVVTVSGTVVDGMVDLTKRSENEANVAVPDWVVHSFDVDAAVARLSDAKTAVTRAKARRARADAGPGTGPAPSADAVMPALRSVGLQLVHRRRVEWFGERLRRSQTNANAVTLANGGPSGLPVLTADDLVLGYRLDVRRGGSDWHSMMQRQSVYTVNDVPIGGGWNPEEGHLPPASGAKGTADEVYADGVVVRWNGHRLSVPQPGPDGRELSAEVVHRGPYRFEWQHAVDDGEPLGLPELRFGDDYQLRLRVLDLAGGGLGPGDVAGDTSASVLTTYARHEPVLPPEMPPPTGLVVVNAHDDGRRRATVASELLGPSGSLTRLVIRSDPRGATPQTPEDLAAIYPANRDRMLLPPAATFTLTEWDDRLNGAGPETWRLVRRARAVPRSSEEPQAGRHYTWVPDAAADGVSATVLPLSGRLAQSGPSLADWDTAGWPDHPPKQVRVVPGDPVAPGASAQPTVNWESSTLAEVMLPPAARAVVELSSAVEARYFQRFAASAWAPLGTDAQQAVITGRHPIVTPALRLEVVHAVRAPLSAPGGVLEAHREPGDLVAVILDPALPLLGIDRDSTAQIDLAASWQEWRDPGPDAAADAAVSARIVQSVGSFAVDLDAAVLPPLVHPLGDTRHRWITYRIAAHSRFRDFFADTDPASAFLRDTEFDPVNVPSTVRPSAPVVMAVTAAFRTTSDVEFGMKYEEAVVDPNDFDGDGIPDADDDFVGPPVGIGFPIATPTVTPIQTREGGMLRVELAAPWFTTGEGEQLGVVVSPGTGQGSIEHEAGVVGAAAAADDANARLVTRAYRDPLVAASSPMQPTAASMTHTGGAPMIIRDLESGVPICVVPFDVVRLGGRWFADIGFGALADHTSLPFVQLKIVRFQRHSLTTMKASPVVTTDLVAVLPGRELRVETKNGQNVVTLTGTGPRGPVELRLESAPTGTPIDGLTSLEPSGPGWVQVWRVGGSLNGAFGGFAVPNDGRTHRIVVREYDAVPLRATPPATGVLEQDNARLPLFVGVIAL